MGAALVMEWGLAIMIAGLCGMVAIACISASIGFIFWGIKLIRDMWRN